VSALPLVGPYLGFVSGTFQKMLAYRLRYYTGIVSYLIYVAINYFIWKAVYADRPPGTLLDGYDFVGMTTYVSIGWIARSFYFNNVDREIGDQVQKGEIALALARPVSYQATILAGAIGEGTFRFFCFTVPVAVVIFLIFPVAAPASALHAAAFVVSIWLALLLLTHLNFLVGMCAFPLKSIDGVMRAKHYLLEILSGLLLPLAMFPNWLKSLSRWLPFQQISFVPTSIWLGKLQGQELALALARQALWVLLFAATCAFVWRRVTSRLTIQGG
jgi:ABC-2 type transport system permease protein